MKAYVEYLKKYAREFNLYKLITFGARVMSVERRENGVGYTVRLEPVTSEGKAAVAKATASPAQSPQRGAGSPADEDAYPVHVGEEASTRMHAASTRTFDAVCVCSGLHGTQLSTTVLHSASPAQGATGGESLPLFHFCHRILLTSQAVVQKIQINSKSNQHFDSQISCSLHLLTVKLLVLAHLALRTSLYNSYTFASVRAQPYCAPYTLNRDNATSMVSAVGVVGKVVV